MKMPARRAITALRIFAAFCKGNRHGHRDDLRPDDLVQFPAEAVLIAVAGDQCGWAASGRSWHIRQAAAARMGRDRLRMGPACVVRSLISSAFCGCARKSSMMSASQSTARFAGLVG